MDQTRFDIFLTGALAPGLSPTVASERLAQLFRSTPAAMANLVTGQPQLLKRGVDAATAQKFREALHRAGLEVTVRAAAIAGTIETPSAAATSANAPTDSGLTLAPLGAEVLTTTERPQSVVVNIDTSHIRLVEEIAEAPTSGRAVFALPDEVVKTAPATIVEAAAIKPDEPDLFTLAPVESELLRPEERTPPPTNIPDIPDLTLAEPGALFETLHIEIETIAPDLSGLSLAPEGAELVSPAEKPTIVIPPMPDISHLHLLDQEMPAP